MTEEQYEDCLAGIGRQIEMAMRCGLNVAFPLDSFETKEPDGRPALLVLGRTTTGEPVYFRQALVLH
ncbi:hypothetical protein [Cupriavidus taiwanensis]|uniref:Uncharacterized protein n=1 Tax=Cupriavidus taiwanensis TaxID=164546 RepID=A0A375J5R8_9BURK|nr:hypothetical protein [Cupriavidus taiwanensis]SPR99303.1 hypothetical protein CBM2634_A80235 [Cupriavidus taiwanensis]